jgi:4-amino-4-deoxychorismate lyase
MILRNGLPSSGDDIVLDDGLQFGRGAFETLRVTTHPVFLERHCERLNLAMERLGLPRRVEATGIAALADRYAIRDCVLKILATRKNELLITRPFPYLPEQYERGFRLALAKTRRSSINPFPGMKTLNYLESLLAREAAAAAGFDDALFLNDRGELSETASANLFFMHGGILHTPEAGCGLLEGILRQWVLEAGSVREGRYSYQDLLHADEVFVTNSVVGIMPVSAVDDVPLPMPVDNSATRMWMQAYTEAVADPDAR